METGDTGRAAGSRKSSCIPAPFVWRGAARDAATIAAQLNSAIPAYVVK
jgi:hypothetical protein